MGRKNRNARAREQSRGGGKGFDLAQLKIEAALELERNRAAIENTPRGTPGGGRSRRQR
jgi:hypothetical protein